MISTHRRIVYQLQELTSFGHGTDTRIVSKMMTPLDKFWVYSSYLFIFPIFMTPQSSIVSPGIDSDIQCEILQKKLGPNFNIVNKTKEYNSEKDFLRNNRRASGLYMVYHTCNLDNYPVRLDDEYNYNNVTYYVFRVDAVAVRLSLYENARKILDYRDAFPADRIRKVGPQSYFETQETLDDRASSKVTDKIKEVLNPL